MKHSPVLFFSEYYWNTECVTFNDPYETYCEFLREEEVFYCTDLVSDACMTAQDLRYTICGSVAPQNEEPEDQNEGSGISGYEEEGSGANGIILADVEI